MYMIKVINLKRELPSDIDCHYLAKKESREEIMEWYEKHLARKTFGNPERWVHEDEMSEWEKKRVIRKEKGEDGKWTCLVPKDFEAKLYKASDYKEKRRKEYPSQEEILEALMENMELRPEKLELVKLKRKAIRDKYPKDETELLETL